MNATTPRTAKSLLRRSRTRDNFLPIIESMSSTFCVCCSAAPFLPSRGPTAKAFSGRPCPVVAVTTRLWKTNGWRLFDGATTTAAEQDDHTSGAYRNCRSRYFRDVDAADRTDVDDPRGHIDRNKFVPFLSWIVLTKVANYGI
jgi:hypothetical protein